MQPSSGHHNQQLQPFNSGSNSAHTSPLKRAPQAVSPLASPMESRRIFMAHQQQAMVNESPPQAQQAQQAMGISALQLGYALPACRLLVDPHTGQQYYVPTAHPLPATPATASAAYFPSPIFYNHHQPAAAPTTAAFYHHSPTHQPPTTTAVAASIPAGAYLYAATPAPTSAKHHQPSPSSVNSSAGYYAAPIHPHHQMPFPAPTNASMPHQFYGTTEGQHHRSQSPLAGRQHHQEIASNSAYRVEIPPSTVDSGSMYGDDGVACEDKNSTGGGGAYGYSPPEHHHHSQQQSPQHQQQYFHRREHCRLSTESRGSSIRGGMDGAHQMDAHSNPDESHYGFYQSRSPPSPLHLPSQNPHHHQQSHRQYKPVPPPPPLLLSQQMTLSAGGGSSSESTSGFASGGRSRTRTFGDEPRSPVPPQSPHREQQAPQQQSRVMTSFGESRYHHHQPNNNYEEERRGRKSPPPPPPAAPRRAIRMDIDLSRPMSPPEHASTTARPFLGGSTTTKPARLSAGAENQSVSVRATVLRTAPPTAFTISFNDNSAQIGEVSISDLSLQEAAKHAPKGRRLMARRSVPPRGPQQPRMQQQSGAGQDSGSECGDPKRWLFRKMMMGREEEEQRPATIDGGGGGQTRRESIDEDEQAEHDDLASEAGTYVVENCRQQPISATMTISQLSGTQTQRDLQSDSSSSSASSSSSTTSRTPGSQKTPSPGPKSPIRPKLQSQSGKRSLMSDLRKLREIGGSTQPTPSFSAVPQKKPVVVSAAQQKLPPAIPPHQRKAQQPTPATTSLAVISSGPLNRPCRTNMTTVTQSQSAFSRNDGGRFSMRPTSSSTASRPLPPVHAGKGPLPMRQQSVNTAVKQSPIAVQKSPEMLNWLRRKEYDPRKAMAVSAAANAEQQKSEQQLKKAQDAFTANRSVSAALSGVGSTATFTKKTPNSPFARWRAVQQQNALPNTLNRSHDDLSRLGGAESLDEESLMGGPTDSYTGGFQRTIDELCQKSVALLKLSGLSSSVEQQLERIVQIGGGSGAGGPSGSGGGSADPAHSSTTEKLEHLSSAFDAIQKYLEEQASSNTAGGATGNFAAFGAGGPNRTMSGTFRRNSSTTAENANNTSGSNPELIKMDVAQLGQKNEDTTI